MKTNPSSSTTFPTCQAGQNITYMAPRDWPAHNSLKWHIFYNSVKDKLYKQSDRLSLHVWYWGAQSIRGGDKIIKLRLLLFVPLLDFTHLKHISAKPKNKIRKLSHTHNGFSITPQVISCSWQVRVGEGSDPPPTTGLGGQVPPHRPIGSHHMRVFLCRWAHQDRGKFKVISISI